LDTGVESDANAEDQAGGQTAGLISGAVFINDLLPSMPWLHHRFDAPQRGEGRFNGACPVATQHLRKRYAVTGPSNEFARGSSPSITSPAGGGDVAIAARVGKQRS
jgi:hypothetical protein